MNYSERQSERNLSSARRVAIEGEKYSANCIAISILEAQVSILDSPQS